MVIFQEEVDRYAYMVVSILLGKNSVKTDDLLFSDGHLVHGAHIGGNFEKKVDEDVCEVGQIL